MSVTTDKNKSGDQNPLKKTGRKRIAKRVGNFLKGNKMADEELRDRSNKLLGKIKTLSNGKLELRDASNKLKGTYDPKTNQTRDASNKFVGKGNLLTTLL